MIRIRLINEGRVVKQITSRVHEGVVLEQIKKYKDPYDTVQIVEGELSEGAKDMLHHVAKKIVPAALAAGMAMSGASTAQAQGGANPHYPGLNHSVGQHMADIFSPNYKEKMRQREHQRSTERQVWNAEQDEIRKQRVNAARAAAGGGNQPVIYDQSRLSQDGKSYIIYGIDNKVRRIPVAGTEYMHGDSQRLPHYITSGGNVLYVRHPHAVTESTELKKQKRAYNQAAKDANADQVGAGKKIDTMKNSLRLKDVNKVKESAENKAEHDKGYSDASNGITKNPYNPGSPAAAAYDAGQQSYKRHFSEGYSVTRGIDKERYQERPGLEGPFSTRSGKVVYYDPKEGKYYDPETDFYIGHEDYAKMDEDAPALVKGAAGLALGGIAAAGAPAIVAILGPLLGIPMAAYGAYSAAKLGMKGVEKLWDMASDKLGGDDKVTQYTNAKLATLPPEQAKAGAAVVKKIGESKQGVVEGSGSNTATLDAVFNEPDFDRLEHIWPSLEAGDTKEALRQINHYLNRGKNRAWWGDLQALDIEIDQDDVENSMVMWSKPVQQGVAEGDPNATVGTIPSTGTIGGSMSQRTQFAPTGKTTNAKFNKNGQIELDTEQEDDGSVNLDADAVKQLQQAGVKMNEGEDSPVASAIARRIMTQRLDLLKDYGPVLVTQAIDEVADFVGDVEEIGSSDVSGWVKHVEQMLRNNPPAAFGESNEGNAQIKVGDIIGFRPTGAKMIPIKAEVLSTARGSIMVQILSPKVVANRGGDDKMTISLLGGTDIQNPYKPVTPPTKPTGTNVQMKEGVDHPALQGWEKMDANEKIKALQAAGFKAPWQSYGSWAKEGQGAHSWSGLTGEDLDDILHAAKVKALNQADELTMSASDRRDLARQASQDFEARRQQLHKEKMEMEKFAWEKANTEAERKHEINKIEKEYLHDLRKLQMSHMQDMEKILHADTHELNKMKAEFNMRQAEREPTKPNNRPEKPSAQSQDTDNQNFDQDTGAPLNPQWATGAQQQLGKDDDVIDVEARPVGNKPPALGNSVKKESTDSLEGILSKYSADYAKFKAGGDIDENEDFFQALFDYYSESGEMPYGVQKARDGDPYEWITQRLDQESGVAPVIENLEEGAEQMTPNWAKYVLDQLYNSNGSVTLTDLFDEGIPGLHDMFMATAQKHGIDPEEDFQDVEHELTLELEDIVKGGHGIDEAEGDEATPGEQAAADQNIIMQIRKASDYEKPTKIELADGTESVIAPNIAKQLLAKFDKMKPESKALLQDTLNTEEGFKEILAYFGGGVREQAAVRVGNIMQSAMAEAGYGRYDRRDAYQRDYDSSVAGMGKRQSYAYQMDGGANDEGWDKPERSYQAPQHTYYIRFKDSGKVYKQKGIPKSFANKAAANGYALAMIRNNPALSGNILLSVDSEDKPTA